MSRSLNITIASALLATSGFAFADPVIVVNGSFEATNIGSSPWTYLGSVSGWTSSLPGSSAFEIQKGATQGGLSGFNTTAYDGKQYLELNTTTLTAVSQALSTTAGQKYSLTFAYSGRPDTPGNAASAVEVFWGGKEVFSTTAAAKSGWHLFTIDNLVATSGSTLLKFQSIAPGSAVSYGSYLDAVSVKTYSPTSAVPEPSTWAMMLTSLLAMGLLASKRKNGQKIDRR